MRSDLVRIGHAVFLAAAALAAAAVTTPASAEIAGTLTCNVAPGTSAIVISQRGLSCTYQSSMGPTELYKGSITRLGVDVGVLQGATLVYQVIELGEPRPGALTGGFVGTGIGLTLGSGGGIDGLIGGNGNSITLQPLAATTSTGVNFNAGVGAIQLSYAGTAGPRLRRHRHRAYHHRHHR